MVNEGRGSVLRKGILVRPDVVVLPAVCARAEKELGSKEEVAATGALRFSSCCVALCSSVVLCTQAYPPLHVSRFLVSDSLFPPVLFAPVLPPAPHPHNARPRTTSQRTTVFWLQEVVRSQREWVHPSTHPAFQPLRCKVPLPGLRPETNVSLSGYEPHQRSAIQALCAALKIGFSAKMERKKSTHLLAASDSPTTKYVKAKECVLIHLGLQLRPAVG